MRARKRWWGRARTLALARAFVYLRSVTSRPIRVLSWNVNGIRACVRKGFLPWLRSSGATVVGLQEVRALADEIPGEIRLLRSWHRHLVAAERRGYSGVGLLSRIAPERVDVALGVERFDCEGRVQIARFGRLVVANVYFPKGSGRLRDNSRVPYKLDFYRCLFDRLEGLRRAGRRVLVLGDFNTAREPIDLARPRDNMRNSGFLPEERAELTRWIEAGWIDTFRRFEPGPGHYSWWSQRRGVREKNVGWRIDYVLASPAAMEHVRAAFIQPHVTGSDHCPVGVDLEAGILV
jgi:exodeoxyribonuclease-3